MDDIRNTKNAAVIVGELCASFERQMAMYKELCELVRKNMSQLILSRGDAGIMMSGVNKKVKIIEAINKEREDIAPHIEFWQANREQLTASKDAARLNDILTKTEVFIKEFLAEEEKLKQYVEKFINKDGG